ncbi:MBL fold metallo-hydrolase [Streptomyces sp. NPDC057702]|uniref:MBL fold metallo-hydrolase n=1 Tax=unclassified Streptomyces TaxID=2593676 RepID=UPI003682395E
MSTTASHQPERLRRPARLRSLGLGETKVTHVPDGAVQLAPRGWLPETTEEVWAAHPGYLDDAGYLVAGIGALLVEHGDRALLIDSGFGPYSLPAREDAPLGRTHGGALLENLAGLGHRPADIEAVAFTHLHIDHLGWAAHRASEGERPAFTGADYLVAEPEWSQRHLLAAHGTPAETLAALEPQVVTVADGQEIFPGVRVRYLLGHTPGHTAYVITGGGRRLIAFGDAMHSPIQVSHPEWAAWSDHDAERAVDFRRRLVAELQEPDTIGFGVHFADVPFGRVHSGVDGPTWRPVDA